MKPGYYCTDSGMREGLRDIFGVQDEEIMRMLKNYWQDNDMCSKGFCWIALPCRDLEQITHARYNTFRIQERVTRI